VPNPSTFNYGFAFEYSLPYLECCVKDIGLREPFNRLSRWSRSPSVAAFPSRLSLHTTALHEHL